MEWKENGIFTALSPSDEVRRGPDLGRKPADLSGFKNQRTEFRVSTVTAKR